MSFFPTTLGGFQAVFSVDEIDLLPVLSAGTTVFARTEDEPSESASLQLSQVVSQRATVVGGAQVPLQPFQEVGSASGEPRDMALGGGLRIEGVGGRELLVLPCPPLAMVGPGVVIFSMLVGDKEVEIGRVLIGSVTPRPISAEERRALIARPTAPRAVALTVGCKTCESRLAVGTCLDPADSLNADGLESGEAVMTLSEAPDQWRCKCGKLDFSLGYLKAGLHELLRHPVSESTSLTSFLPLYEESRLDRIISDFAALVDTDPVEEALQAFIEGTPIVWAFLRPFRILHKPPILTRFKADFGILSAEGVLHLVEIERAGTRLITKDGRIAASIQRGADQLRDWREVVDRDRTATLREMGLDPERVATVRYLLIGGRTRGASAGNATKLRRGAFGEGVSFLSYDDLLSFLGSVKVNLPTL